MALENKLTHLETCCVRWKIDNLAEIGKSNELEWPQFHFKMGESIGLPTKFICRLKRYCFDVDVLYVSIGLDEQNLPDASNIYINVEIRNRHLLGMTDSFKDMLLPKHRSGFDLRLYSRFDENETYSHAVVGDDGSLTLNIQVTLFGKKSMALSTVIAQFQSKFWKRLQRDFFEALENSNQPSDPTMVTMFTKDGKEFLVDREMISARSPVFHSMFQTPMQEAHEGIVRINDISGKTLEALLLYMETGKLSENWNDSDILEEFVYAANKYLLEDLQEFLDHALGLTANLQNCGKLLSMATKYSMKKAETDLLKCFQSYWGNASSWQQMKEMFQGLDEDTIKLVKPLCLKKVDDIIIKCT